MSRTVLTLLLLATPLATASAQTDSRPGAQRPPAAPAVTADDTLERYVRALGGRAAFEKISTRVTKGSYEIVGTPVKGEQEVYAKAPNMATTVTTLPGLGVTRDGYDGQTGRGQVENGEGVYGLRRALVLAGAESQVMSLWQVADEATKDLMVGYYKRLQSGERRAAALRQVQLDALRGRVVGAAGPSRGIGELLKGAKADRSHPYFWAAFIQSGDWRPMN